MPKRIRSNKVNRKVYQRGKRVKRINRPNLNSRGGVRL